MMKLQETGWDDIWYIYEEGELVGVRYGSGEKGDIFLGDVVSVTEDEAGRICSGINNPGIGMVVCVRVDVDHFFKIKMANGEEGYCKGDRLEVMLNPVLPAEKRALFEQARNEEAVFTYLREMRKKKHQHKD